jgi:hypothetical protein
MPSNVVMLAGGKSRLAPPFWLPVLLVGGLNFSFAQSTSSPAPDATTQTEIPSPQPDLKPDVDGSLSQEQMRQLFRAVADNDLENDKHLRDYTYIERVDEHKLDGKGGVKSTEVTTYEVMELYGERVRRMIEKHDKPLDASEAAKEEEKVQKIIDKRKNESEEARRKRVEKDEKDREEGRQFVREVADAYNFHLAGTETMGGRDVWVIDAQPRPGYEPRMKDARFLPKFRFRAWIDRRQAQWAKLDIECIDTVSVGLFLARIHKGSRIAIEQTRVNDEVWLPQHMALEFDARIALLKEYNLEQDVTFGDYKKFRATARVVNPADSKP